MNREGETSKDGDHVNEGQKHCFGSNQSETPDRRLHRSSTIRDLRDRKLYETTHLVHDY